MEVILGSSLSPGFEVRLSESLSSQFEGPLFLYAICVLRISSDSTYSSTYLSLAWVLVLGRFIHRHGIESPMSNLFKSN